MAGLETVWRFLTLLLQLVYHFLFAVIRLFLPRPLKDVSNDIVLITGGAQGIGKEIAVGYGRLGAKVIIVDLNKEIIDATTAQLKRDGINIHSYVCDVAKREDVIKLAETVIRDVGPVTILVNNAGIISTGNIFRLTEPEIRKIFEVNTISHFWMLQTFLPSMIKMGYGHVVAMCSQSGLIGIGNLSAYSSSKFAVRGLMEAIRRELERTNSNVKLTTVFPFFVNTGFCKQSRVGILPELSPTAVARAAIKAQRQGLSEVSVPGILHLMHNISHIVPSQCIEDAFNYLGCGVDDQT